MGVLVRETASLVVVTGVVSCAANAHGRKNANRTANRTLRILLMFFSFFSRRQSSATASGSSWLNLLATLTRSDTSTAAEAHSTRFCTIFFNHPFYLTATALSASTSHSSRGFFEDLHR